MGLRWLKKGDKNLLNEAKELQNAGGIPAVIETTVKAMTNSGAFQQAIRNINRSVALYPGMDFNNLAERYATTDDIYSIIRMLATTAALVPIRAYEVKGDKKEELSEPDPLAMLLANPSENMGAFEFYYALYSFLFYSGNCLILKDKPELGVNAGKVINLQFLHPQNITLKVTDTLPRRVLGYDYTIDGLKVLENIPVEDVIHIKNFNPELGYNGSELWGLSTISVLRKRLVQNDSNNDVQTAQMQNGGVESIIVDTGTQFSGDDPKEIAVNGLRKQAYYAHLKEPTNKSVPFMTNTDGDIKVLSIGSTLADLKVIESAKVNFAKLCNAFGTSDVLFNNGEASTESNVKEMTRRTYTNTTLPDVYKVRDALKRGLLPDFKDGKKRDIQEDISGIPELQENMKEMAETFSALPIFIPNDVMEAFKYGRSVDPDMDKVYIKTGYTPLEDLQTPDPLEVPTPNGN